MTARTIKEAEAAGADAARRGCNPQNCHFSIFLIPALSQAWTRGWRAVKFPAPMVPPKPTKSRKGRGGAGARL